MRKKFLRRLALGMAVVVGITSVSVSNLGSAKAETNVTATSQSEEATLPVTIGATDCSTAWWGAHSENWNVEKGQTLVVSFINYNRYDPAIGNFVEGTNPTGYQSYQNYAVVFSSAPFGDAAYAEWMVSSAAHNSWGSKVPTGNPNQRSWVNWETHGVDYNGASMKLVVSRDENNVVTYTAYALSTDGDRWYNGNTFTLTDSDDCFVHLTVDNSYLTITDIQYYEGVVVGAPDMSSGHDFCPTPSIEVNDGDTVTYNLVNYVGAYNHEAVRTFLSNVAFGGADRSDYLIMRLDNYIDGGTCKGADGWNTNVGTLATNYNWDVFRSACSGAPTTLTVSRSGARVTYRIDIDGLDGVKYYNEAQIDLPSETDPCYVWLSTTFSYFVMDTGIAHADAGPDLKVDVDKTVQVEPGIVASFSDITYTSSDPSVATVDANGVVTGVDNGTATITVTYTNGESVASDTCTVTVYKPMTGITVDKSEVDLYVGPGEDTHTIKVTVAPSDTTDIPVITYESSDETVATVSEDGEVTAVGPGTATITVTATAGDNVQTAEVKVNAWQEPTLIKVDNSEIVVNTGKTEQIKYTVLPENVNVDYTVKFDTTDTDTDIATIDANGVVTGVIPGTTSVYVELYIGENETASYASNVTITVKQPMTGIESSVENNAMYKGD
ncbi:MAG: Ig domain-containing protein [Lachnospiraceae bacterium]|nr:Ig domain-containing protein [Lachnospiraceae bacterium]